MKTGTSGSVSEHDQRRGEVDRRDPGQHGHRHDAGEQHLREVPGEVRLEGVDPLDRGRRDLGGVRSVESCRLSAKAIARRAPSSARRAPRRLPAARRPRTPRRERLAADEDERRAGPAPRRDLPERCALERIEPRSMRSAMPAPARGPPPRRPIAASTAEQEARRRGHDGASAGRERACAQAPGAPPVLWARASTGDSTFSPFRRARKT